MLIQQHIKFIAVNLTLCFALTTLSIATTHCAEPQAEAAASSLKHKSVIPAPRIAEWWFARQAEKIGLMSKGDIDLLMVGDSITHNFENEKVGLKVWEKYFVPLKAVNIGFGEEGDQILDGMGETDLIARYLFSGNAEDASRHNRHATLHGTKGSFVGDDKFGTVLSLPGKADSYVVIPSQILSGVESMSVTAWVHLTTATPGQRLFDFGQDKTTSFSCAPTDPNTEKSYRVCITSKGGTEFGPTSPRVETGRWIHLAVVLDPANQTLSSYADGVRVGHATGVTLTLDQVLDQENTDKNRLYIGKSHYSTDPNLNGKLHDFRIYSIALSNKQVARIYRGALSEDEIAAMDEQPSAELQKSDASSHFDVTTLHEALGLTDVPDISVGTTVGHLPQLPHLIEGVYRTGVEGPKVSVIWPFSKSNQQVLKVGTYTVTGRVPGTDFKPKATVTVRESAIPESAPKRMLEQFALGQVALNLDNQERKTPLIKNRDKFIHTLAETDPDRFLYMFRDAFGQPQPEGVKPLGGWDSQTTKLRGHASGHYLSAVAQAYASTTYDAKLRATFLAKMDYLIETLHDLSQRSGKSVKESGQFNADPIAVPHGPGKSDYSSDLSVEGIRTDYWNWGEGFISAYPPDQFILLEKGATYGGRENQIWAPYYTLHKILAGLLDCYEVGGNEKALQIARGMGLWVHARLEKVPTATRISMWNRYIAGEYGGMNEVMARLYRITGDKRFLQCAQLFDNTEFFFGNADHDHGLAKNVDTLHGKHANQHIPQITGALETYMGTHNPEYFRVAENFWSICTNSYMYSIGGVAGASTPKNAECFTVEPNTLFVNGFAKGGQNETCATYNLLKLSRQLFMFETDGKYMDYYEQAFYNHILASVAEDSPGNTYHVPLGPGCQKHFGNPIMDGFSCCNGTALESSTKLQDSIYFRDIDNHALYVNLYVPSTVTWVERHVVVQQQTSFPYADTTRLVISDLQKSTGAGNFAIKVRVPRWAKSGFFVKINGEEVQFEAPPTPGTYLTLNRTWKKNDTIELRMPLDFHLWSVMDRPNIASIFYGPILLAAEEPSPRADWRTVHLNPQNLKQSISGDPNTLRFQIGDVKLRPFFETYSRHSVYLDVILD
jgi:DUF1680 family protein